MPNLYLCNALTGGAAKALDSLKIGTPLASGQAAALADGDIAFIINSSYKLLIFQYKASATDAENVSTHPYRVRPDDYASQGVWYEVETIIVTMPDNVTQADSKYFATDKVRARDADGLYLVDDADKGLFIKDGGIVSLTSDRASFELYGSKTSDDGNYADIMSFNNSTLGSQISFRRIGNDNELGIIFYSAIAGSLYEIIRILPSGAIGIQTITPSRVLDVNQGSGNMIADGYDTHSLSEYKENIKEMSSDLDDFINLKVFSWQRPPYVSADELACLARDIYDIEKEILKDEALEEIEIESDVVIEENGEKYKKVIKTEVTGFKFQDDGSVFEVKAPIFEKEKKKITKLKSWARFDEKTGKFYDTRTQWKAAFPDVHRGGKLKTCPDTEILDFLNNKADEIRAERRQIPKWQKEYYGLVADDETLLRSYPDMVAYDDVGNPKGVNLNNHVGLLHSILKSLVLAFKEIKNEIDELKDKKN